MDVHDVPSASKPEKNLTIKNSVGPDFIYKFLRLRIPLEVGMVVVSFMFVSKKKIVLKLLNSDRRTWLLLP
jgi:hypothetical protein